MVACDNWNLNQITKKYRSEELQEVFAKSNSSLRYDRNRQQFVTVTEALHPVYRALYDALAYHNERVRRVNRMRKWFRSVLEMVQCGVYGADTQQPQLLRLRNTLANLRWAERFTALVRHIFPLAPVTGQLPIRPSHRFKLLPPESMPSGTRPLGAGLGLSFEVSCSVQLQHECAPSQSKFHCFRFLLMSGPRSRADRGK